MLRGEFITPVKAEFSTGKVFVNALAFGGGMNIGEHAELLNLK